MDIKERGFLRLMQPIHWFPGHMAKAKRQLTEMLKYLDIIIEVRDARIPLISHNSDLKHLFQRRPVIIVLNKADLAEASITKEWQSFLMQQGALVAVVNGRNGNGVKEIWDLLNKTVQLKSTRPKRVGVVGIPNVGKSSVLNRLLGVSTAKTGNLPGVTRGKQWVKKGGFELLDTPGLLPPKIQDQAGGFRLAMIGTIRDEIIPSYDLALLLIEQLGVKLFSRFGESELVDGQAEEILDWFGRKRGFLVKGGEVDLHRAAITLLKDFREGRLGKFSLEFPGGDSVSEDF